MKSPNHLAVSCLYLLGKGIITLTTLGMILLDD